MSNHSEYLNKVLLSRVYDVAVETPLDEAVSLSRRLGNRVLLKRDDLQPVFSFKLRGAYNAIAKKDEIKRQATRRSRDVLDRALNSAASIYRDIAVLQNNAEDAVGLINMENRTAIAELSARLSRQEVVDRLEAIAVARKRLLGNGNPMLVFEALFCALIPGRL